LALRVLPEALPIVGPAYEAALASDIERMANAIPARELAIQWDCTEPSTWDRMSDTERQDAIDRLVRVGALVPEGVELGYHLCYGDFEHQHSRQPPDTSEMVEMANAIASRVRRSMDWVHMPVPRDRSDVAYFNPLRDLKLATESSLYLGLVHYTDGLEGARARIASAEESLSAFGIATECGFGRRPKDQDIRRLMELHVKVAEI
jgi:methionine synthase II (cobalamin-independent)